MRMIERWFPCAEVSDASERGWGSGQSEKSLFVWFATRPLAQAKAAVLTSLLPWPEDPREQRRLQDLVRRALTAYDAAHKELVDELAQLYPAGATTLDPFSGRAVIPLEAARLGVRAWGFDYSPIATLAGELLADYPLRDWSREPDLPFEHTAAREELFKQKLLHDVRVFLDEVGCRFQRTMAAYYPLVKGKRAWGYLWAATVPCQECGRRFPLVASLQLRTPLSRRDDPGQSFRIETDERTGNFSIIVHSGAQLVRRRWSTCSAAISRFAARSPCVRFRGAITSIRRTFIPGSPTRATSVTRCCWQQRSTTAWASCSAP
jgi:putative DNA methylase